tara:strand:- start:4823 stop:6367 length:1545 start_codon:yes stop_codon:yes gene_type:complete
MANGYGSTNFSLGGLSGIPGGTSPEGIPYKTELYSLPMSMGSGGYFYGTGADPSQRFIFQRLRRDTQGNPIKMFEEWENFDDEDKQWIAEQNQRRDELPPEDINTLDLILQVAGKTAEPFLQDAAAKYLYATDTTFGTALDRAGVDAAQTAMEFGGESPLQYSWREASPIHTTAYNKAVDIANKAPPNYAYNPELEKRVLSGEISGKGNQLVYNKEGNVYFNKHNPPDMNVTHSPRMDTSKIRRSDWMSNLEGAPMGTSGYGSSQMSQYVVPGAAGTGINAAAQQGFGGTGYGMMTGGTQSAVSATQGAIPPDPGFWSGEGFSSRAGEAFAPTQMASNFAVSFAVGLALGSGKPLERAEEAADSALGSTVGTAIGTAIGGPIGGFIGGAIGGLIGSGGRVICNELMRQKLLSKQDVILDYKFTRDYLTPTHVRGYHVWAIHVVQQMRKGRFVKFWKHIAKHRANEIAYIYGKKDKPDYLGKIYRKILEPTCWVIGVFCEQSDWSILYKEKKIGN